MNFAVSCLLEYETQGPLTFLLNVRAHLGAGQRCLSEHLSLPSGLHHRVQNCAATGTRFDRIHANHAGRYEIRYQAQVETTVDRFFAGELIDSGPEAFDTPVLPYLYPSRYCQSDRFEPIASELVRHLPPYDAEGKVRAITHWIASHLSYVSGSSNAATSAVDTLVDRMGVCRDYAHLGIALCRALNIPARYFTGYAHLLNPPDFHACFETWVGSRWLVWDATGLASPDGMVRIGTGRDASDCSICTSFGNLFLLRQEVYCDALDPHYLHMDQALIQNSAISLEPISL